MKESTLPVSLESRKDALVASLADWTETLDPCEYAHVEHGPEDHIGRHLVHTYSAHGFGANWDYDDAVAFIQAARYVAPSAAGRYVEVQGADGEIIRFEAV